MAVLARFMICSALPKIMANQEYVINQENSAGMLDPETGLSGQRGSAEVFCCCDIAAGFYDKIKII